MRKRERTLQFLFRHLSQRGSTLSRKNVPRGEPFLRVDAILKGSDFQTSIQAIPEVISVRKVSDPTNNEVILRRDLGLKSHSKDQRSRGSILRSLDW